MSTNNEGNVTDQRKESIFLIKDLYEITVDHIKDPICARARNGKEKALSELRRQLKPAKNIRSSYLIQEMGSMILKSSDDVFIIDMAQRLAKNSIRRRGEKVDYQIYPNYMKIKRFQIL